MNYKNFEFNHRAAVIIHTRRTYRATGGGWSYKPAAEYSEQVTTEFYNNFITSVPFFNSRVKWAATDCGRLPVELVTISPDGAIKHVDIFKITVDGGRNE